LHEETPTGVSSSAGGTLGEGDGGGDPLPGQVQSRIEGIKAEDGPGIFSEGPPAEKW